MASDPRNLEVYKIIMDDGRSVVVPEDLVRQVLFEAGLNSSTIMLEDFHRPLEELGVDSLFRVEIVMLLEEYLAVDIYDEEVVEAKVKNLEDFFLLPTVLEALIPGGTA